MTGTRGLGRILAMGIALAVMLLLVVVGEARAGKYAIAQCGWYAGLDADWADTTGGAKFRPDAYCVPPSGGDPFDGSFAKSFTREGQGTVSGTRFGRWRWSAPGGVRILQVSGTWWHALHDGIEHRLGGVVGANFEPFAIAAATDTAPREFVAGFPSGVYAIEDRLLCARAESNSCSLDPGSWSALRALTITAEDISPPAAGIGGELTLPGWHRGIQSASIWGGDTGAGIRFSEIYLDGRVVARTDYDCAMVNIAGEWRATRMQPCALGVSTTQTLGTAAFSDGPHPVFHCVTGFDGDGGCTSTFTLLTDNTAPAHPRSPSIAGGDGWRRVDDFDLSWENPDQGLASPISGVGWRLTGPGGFDSGVQFAGGRDRTTLADLRVPGPGSYPLQLWLRDEAGNEAPAEGVTVPLLFDDVAPGVAFANGGEGPPPQIVAAVGDAHSGPVSGSILYRRAEAERWIELPTKLVAGTGAGVGELRAPTPELGPGVYLFRAEVADAAGNSASTSLRADGTRMEARVGTAAAKAEVAGRKTRLFARLRGGSRDRKEKGRGDSLTVPFGAPVRIVGRLTDAAGAGIAGRELRVVARPSRGALDPAAVLSARTGERGGFELELPPGPSRRIAVSFAGAEGLDPARRSPLGLRVRSRVTLRAEPRRLRTGEAVRLSGLIATSGAALPRRGKLVAIQYFEQEARRWRPVLVTRSDHDGRFRARYRFRYVSGTASIRLRATALAEERWPYAPGSSSPVTVDVSGR